jgi:hypothetical protein
LCEPDELSEGQVGREILGITVRDSALLWNADGSGGGACEGCGGDGKTRNFGSGDGIHGGSVAAIIIGAIVALLLLVYGGLYWLFATASVTTHGTANLDTGNIAVPTVRSAHKWLDSHQLSPLLVAGLTSRAAKPISQFDDWQSNAGKIRIVLALAAKLRLGERSVVEQVNRYLLQCHPWGNVGTRWRGNPTGDYDFTLTGLTLVLYNFGDDPALLYPTTTDHIVKVLLTEDGGASVTKIWTRNMLKLPL